MNKETLKQILDAMKLHTAETHPIVETERAMEMIEAELSQKPVRREQQLFMEEQAFYAAPPQTMRPAELAERLKRGEKWAVGQEQPAQQEPVLFIHPSTLEMASAHVGAWKPGHELPGYIALYATLPQRQPLTVDQVWQNDQLMSLNADLGCSMDLLMEVVRAIEAAHDIKEQS